jgi:hypothetical protein
MRVHVLSHAHTKPHSTPAKSKTRPTSLFVMKAQNYTACLNIVKARPLIRHASGHMTNPI